MSIGINDLTTMEDLAAWTEWHLRDQFPGHRFASPANYRADALDLEPLDDGTWHVGSLPSAQPEASHA
jgi:hypothetical protein